MRITVLTENTSRCGFPTEHGLSLYVESGQQHFLFDTGQTALFSENAERLGIDLGSVDFAVLSHGHYDHGGGIMRFLEINDHAPVYMNPSVFEPHYNGTEKYIGLNPGLKSSGRIVFTEEGMQVSDSMTLYPALTGRIADFEHVNVFCRDGDRKLLSEMKKILILG